MIVAYEMYLLRYTGWQVASLWYEFMRRAWRLLLSLAFYWYGFQRSAEARTATGCWHGPGKMLMFMSYYRHILVWFLVQWYWYYCLYQFASHVRVHVDYMCC